MADTASALAQCQEETARLRGEVARFSSERDATSDMFARLERQFSELAEEHSRAQADGEAARARAEALGAWPWQRRRLWC
jgi:predicted nuclease with TOPRIM domain